MINPSKLSAKIKRYVKILGPGLITGASDDDPSGIATYSQAGAAFGFAPLWTALITFPLMSTVQEMCARIGMVTKTGLSGTIKAHYSKWILYIMILFSFPAITLNIGADIQSMGAVAHLVFPQIPIFTYSIFFTCLLIFIIIRFPYKKLSMVLKWLCISLFLYLIVPFLMEIDWWAVFKSTFIPTIQLNQSFLLILVAILGTTISPYLFFWQATMEAEDVNHNPKKIVVNKHILNDMKKDVNVGMFFSNLVMFFIILTTGAVLHKAGVKQIDTVGQVAQSLEPLTGKLSYLLFAIGVIGTGMLAIPVLAGSLSYMLAETFDWKQGLDKKFHQAKSFYITIIVSLLIGLSMDFLGISPIQGLIYTAVLYGLTAPVLIGIILHICNNSNIMGEFINKKYSNIIGSLAFIIMLIAAIALLFFQFK